MQASYKTAERPPPRAPRGCNVPILRSPPARRVNTLTPHWGPRGGAGSGPCGGDEPRDRLYGAAARYRRSLWFGKDDCTMMLQVAPYSLFLVPGTADVTGRIVGYKN